MTMRGKSPTSVLEPVHGLDPGGAAKPTCARLRHTYGRVANLILSEWYLSSNITILTEVRKIRQLLIAMEQVILVEIADVESRHMTHMNECLI